MPDSEFSEGFRGHLLLVLLSRAADFSSQVWLRLVPPLEGFYPLPDHPSRHSGPVELHKMIRHIIVDANYHVWTEPTLRELTHRAILVVEAVVID